MFDWVLNTSFTISYVLYVISINIPKTIKSIFTSAIMSTDSYHVQKISSRFCIFILLNMANSSIIDARQAPNYTFVFNPLKANIPFLHPLKTSGNLRFFDVFRRYRNETFVRNGFKNLVLIFHTFVKVLYEVP